MSLASEAGDNTSTSSEPGEDDDPGLLDEEDVEQEPLQWHNDHWDQVYNYDSFYVDNHELEIYQDWNSSHIRRGERSTSNDSLYDNPVTQQWQSKLARLTRSDLHTLTHGDQGYVEAKLPLFQDDHLDTGGEYQIDLHLGRRKPGLVQTKCPQDPVSYDESQLSKPLIRVTYQLPPPEEATPASYQGIPFPRFGIQLGTLTVRTNFHRAEKLRATLDRPPGTEYTDFQVILDAEHEAMPIWIMCSRQTLRERRSQFGRGWPNLPIFKGLMGGDGDGEFGYDAACILDSVHRLGERPSFEEACDLVQRTRAVVDPGIRWAPLAKLEEITGGAVPAVM